MITMLTITGVVEISHIRQYLIIIMWCVKNYREGS